MKKLLLLMTLFCVMFSTVKATEVEIGDPDNAGTNTYLPCYTLYNYGWTQQIYTAEEIGQAGTINSLTLWLYHTAGASATPLTIKIYMMAVSKESFESTTDWVAMTESDLVYSGTLTVTHGSPAQEYTFELDAPFAYNGTDNLLIAFANNTGSYKSYLTGLVYDGEANSAMYIYQDSQAYDISNPGTAKGRLAKKNVIMLDMTTSGGGPTCDKPESVEANDVTANSATINWIGSASAYNLQYKASSDQEWTLVKNLSGNTYQLSNLVSNTAYQAQVQAICGENTSGWKSVSFSTLIGLPYSETFDATTIPAGWNRYTGALNDDGSATLTATTSYWLFGNYNGVFDNHAHIEVYGTRNAWLVTPGIPVPALEEGDPGYHMLFNLALTYWSGANVPEPASQPDARLVVLVSLDGGNNWITLREWNNTGSEYVFDDITCSAEGEEVDLDLTAYAGQTIQLAFYLYHNTTGDNRIHVDNFLVEKIPTCLKPTDLHTVDGAATSSTLPVAWTANSGETAWRLQYKPTADAEAEWITLDIAANPYTITGLNAFAEYEIRVAAVCSEEDFTDYGKSIKAKTAAIVPFFQSFDTTAMPGEWKRYEVLLENVQESGAELVPTKDGWNVGAKNGVFGNEHLYLNIKDSTDYWLVSPVIEMQAGYQLTFDLALTTNAGSTPTAVTAGEQNDDKFIVFISTDGGAEWTALGTWDNGGAGTSFDQISTEGQTIKFELNDYAGQSIMLAFYGESTESNGNNNLHISNVAIDLIPACERPLSITVGGVTGSAASISWDADGDGQWEYGYVANPAADFAPAETDYTGTTDVKYVDLSGLAETTDYIFFVRRACSETEKSEPLMKAFKTIQTPAALPYNGDFEEANGWLFFNGTQANGWAWGSATANGGQKSLYVSNDGGLTNEYTNTSTTFVYATKTFYFPEAGMYSFSYDWKANGEGATNDWDYLRVALAPANAELVAGTRPTGLTQNALPEGWVALDGGGLLNLQTEWQHKNIELQIEQPGYLKVVLTWKNDGSTGNNPPAAIDNFKISKLSCRMPQGLSVSDITATTASFSWNDDEDGMTWVYACVPAGQEPTEYTDVNQNSLLLEGLEESTAYDFYLRKHCGENEDSEPITISFNTKQLPAEVGNAYVDDFESGNRWLFENGTLENVWVYGEAAHNGEGTHALYISNDGGTTNAYTLNKTTVVFASKMFHFQNGAYTFQYDWRANGEGASTRYDYLRVALVPEDAEFVAGTTLPAGVTYQALPNGCVALDGGIALNLQADWQTFATDAINIAEGNYKVVLLWRNDSGSGSQTPAAVDNFSISRIVCATPANFAAIDTTATTSSIQLTWTPMSEETNWVVRYKEQGAEEWAAVVPAANDTFLLEGLNPSTVYEAQVATQCDPADETAISAFSASIVFATECAAVATLSEGFEGTLLCWSAIKDGNGYPSILSNYPEDAHGGTKFLYFASQVGYSPVDEYIVLPELISLEGMRLKFYARNDYEDASENATLVVGVMPAQEDTANFVVLDTIVLTSNVYNQYIVPFTDYSGEGKYVAIKMLAATIDLASALIDDVVVDEIPNCTEPVGPIAVLNVTADSAYLSWPAEEATSWKYAYAPADAAEPADEAFVAVTDTFVALSDLEDCISYTFYLRRDCGSLMSPSITTGFTTLLKKATVPFADDFEGVNKWLFINGTLTNAWAYGEAAHNGEGSHALYISNDNGANNAYTVNSAVVVYAVKPFHFEDGNYIFQYDWNANGESNYDYLRVALIPDSIELTASTSLPSGLSTTAFPAAWNAVALDGGSKLNLVDAWQTVRTDAIAVAEGDYKVVLLWRDDTSGGSQTPAAVDNFSIEKLTCIRPDSLAVVAESITKHSAQIDWAPISGESNWLIQYKKAAEEAWTLVAEDVNVHPFTINGLDASSVYEIRVAAWCDPTDSAAVSDYSMPITVMTECEAISVFPFGENFDSYTGVTSSNLLPICWNQINTCTYSTYSYYPTTYKSTTYAKSGENSLRFYSYVPTYTTTTDYDPQDQYAILPEMDDVNTLRLKFYARAYSTSYDADFYVGVMSDPSDTTTFEVLDYIELESTTYEAFDIKLNGYHGNGKYIAIKMPAATYSYRGFHMDDITVEKLPACMEPEDVVASNFTASSATISWTNGAEGQTAWQIVYSCDPEFDLAEATPIDIASNPYELTGLEADTLYTVYVRANCGETDGTSLWASTTFRTAKNCQTPDAVAAADITYNSASISWNSYGQTGFNLRYSTDGENWTVATNVESPYVLSNLTATTVYRVQVQAACEAEDAWAGSFTFKTAYAAPFFEAFDATTIPADWSQAQGLLSDILAGGAFTTGSMWNFGAGNNGVFDNHARINIYGTGRKHWLITPAVFIAENHQLTFDMALTVYTSGSSAAPTAGNQADDKFAVVISTDGGATWSVLREWNNSGSEYVYDNISNAGEEIAIDLTAYAGQAIMIGFYGESTVTGGDNNLHIDNVRIDAIPACAKPQALVVSDVFARNATLAWESDASAWEIALDTLAGFNPDTLQSIITVAQNPITLENLLPNHTYYVYVRANCGNDGVSYWTARQSFKTTIACPAPEGLAAQLTPGNGSIATLVWEAASAQAWSIEYSLNSDMSDSIAIFVTEPVANLTGLTAEATYYARVKADCGELDGQSVYTATISFVPTNIYSIVVNDGTQTNTYVPIYGSYVDEGNTASQFIVPAESLQEILWDSITELTFYASQASVDWGAAEFEVYMTTTEDAALAALNDWDNLTQVMVAGNLSIVDNKMVVTLNEPFQYTGDNLLIGFKQTVAGTWKAATWYGKNTTGASIGGYGTGNNMTQRNFLPKMTVNYVPGQAPACMWASHLEVSEITAAGATFAWDSIEGANWEYAVVLAGSNEAPTQFAPATNPIVLDNLEETTAYLFYVRNNCDVENSKLVSVAFTTTENVQSIPYATQFADASGWKMANSENAWVINNNQLYISNDGQAYAYNEDATSVSFATKLFNFDSTTVYTVSYDWMSVGEWNDEDGALDFLRVALVPAAVELTAGVQPEGLTGELLPDGWIALDGDSALTRHATWQTVAAEVTVAAGQYRLAFIWINDESGSDGDPAAIRNLSIAKGTITGIQAGAGFGSKAVKFIKNNQVYILVNGNIYDAIGRKIK